MNFSGRTEIPFFGITMDVLAKSNLSVLGIPWDASSSHRKGAAAAPAAIRQSTTGVLYNKYSEYRNIDLAAKWRIYDHCDAILQTSDAIEAREEISESIRFIVNVMKEFRFLFLGGDHLSTYFSFHSLAEICRTKGKSLGIVYLDAHPDLYAEYEGDKYSHGCVLRRIIEETEINPRNIVQAGIRAATPEQLEYIQELGITYFSRKDFQESGGLETGARVKLALEQVADLVYLSIDLDVLDPAFAPGVGNPEPGGLATFEVVDFIHSLAGLPIFALDVVELCPVHDHSNITAFAAAKLIKETLGIMK
ncbi:MAG: agmatinase [Candidatus Hodarchaeota archaeon]